MNVAAAKKQIRTFVAHRRTFAVCLAVIALLLVSGCLGTGSGPTQAGGTDRSDESVLTSQPVADPSGCRPDAASGVLRLWWPDRLSLNPLLESSRAGKAVNDLIFQGLFTIGADERAEPALASQMTVWDYGLKVMVAIRDDAAFHDGSAVTAEDAAASLMFLLAQAPGSVYRDGLDAVLSARAVDEELLEIMLSRPDPWLAWSLTFPVVPAASLEDASFALRSGTGVYRMASYDELNGLLLERHMPSDPSALRQIRVSACSSQEEAMKAFERDELDLVMLDSSRVGQYALRSSLRLDQYAGREQFFIAMNTQDKQLLQEPARLAAAKLAIWQARPSLPDLGLWAELTDTGVPAESWLAVSPSGMAGDSALDISGIFSREATGWDPALPALSMIVPHDDQRRCRLADDLAAALEVSGIAVRVEQLDRSGFWQALTEGRYDLAMLLAVLPERPVPGWYLGTLPDAAFEPVRQLAGQNGLPGYADWLASWQSQLPAAYLARGLTEPINRDWQDAFLQATARSPLLLLLSANDALVYGHRVFGQCRPNRYHPYENIEELWIWSGQSSSSS